MLIMNKHNGISSNFGQVALADLGGAPLPPPFNPLSHLETQQFRFRINFRWKALVLEFAPQWGRYPLPREILDPPLEGMF